MTEAEQESASLLRNAGYWAERGCLDLALHFARKAVRTMEPEEASAPKPKAWWRLRVVRQGGR